MEATHVAKYTTDGNLYTTIVTNGGGGLYENRTPCDNEAMLKHRAANDALENVIQPRRTEKRAL